MTDKTTIEFLPDGNDFIIRNIKMTFADLWTPDDFGGRSRFSATLETSDKEIITKLVRKIQAVFKEAGKKITAKDVLLTGKSAKTFVRARIDGKTGEDYNIVLRARDTNPPKVLTKDFKRLSREDGEGHTFGAIVNAIGGMLITETEGVYCYGALRTIQILEPGAEKGISYDESARLLGGEYQEDDIRDHAPSSGSEYPRDWGKGGGGTGDEKLGPPDDFDDELPF